MFYKCESLFCSNNKLEGILKNKCSITTAEVLLQCFYLERTCYRTRVLAVNMEKKGRIIREDVKEEVVKGLVEDCLKREGYQRQL